MLGSTVCHAEFDGYQSRQSLVTSGLSSPWQIAVDGNGNVYIADSGNNRIVKETPSASGYTQGTVPTSALSGPEGVAVDANGNVYIADTGNGRILREAWSGTAWSESVIVPATPYGYPTNLALDSNANIYIVDASELVKETVAGNSYTPTTLSVGAAGSTESVAVDASGNLYVGDYTESNGSWIFKAAPSGSGYTVTPVETSPSSLPVVAFGIAVAGNGSIYLTNPGYHRILQLAPHGPGNYYYGQTTEDEDLSSPYGIAVDSSGNVYVADNGNDRVVRDAIANGNLGPATVGDTSPAMSLIFRNYGYSTPMGAPLVITSGIAGGDFSDAGTGSCTTNGPNYLYAYGQSCTVDVKFTPESVGPIYGSVELLDPTSGSIFSQGYMFGTGTGPRVDFLPGTQSTVVSGVSGPAGLAVDPASDLYLATGDGSLLKETLSGGTYAQSTIITGISGPRQVALDGAGTAFVAEAASGGNAGQVVWIGSIGGGPLTVYPIAGTFVSPSGVAIDGTDDLYIADNGQIIKESASWAGWISSTILSGGSTSTTQLALDADGNLYIANWIPGDVVKETRVNNTYAQSIVASGLNSPSALTVDAAGNVYIADTGNHRVLEASPFAYGYNQTVLATGLDSNGIALDSSGNLYATDSSGSRVLKLDFADPPGLTFASTPYLTTSADSPQNVTVENTGNATLNFPALTTGDNPSISSSFALDTSVPSACPDVSASSPTGVLNAGSSCQLSTSFMPAVAGDISGAIVLTDGPGPSLSTASQQTIQLSGTGLPTPQPSFSLSGTSPTFAAGATTGNTSLITVTPAGGFIGNVTLTAMLASSPAGAVNPPTFILGASGLVIISGISPGTATLTVSTKAASQGGCTASSRQDRLPWAPTGGILLACAVLFAVPARRRSWRAINSVVVLLAAACGALVGCGGDGNKGGYPCTSVAVAGTSPGTYTVIITGTSGTTTATGAITVVVQ
jgi:sugar lactone lactonase YvrE